MAWARNQLRKHLNHLWASHYWGGGGCKCHLKGMNPVNHDFPSSCSSLEVTKERERKWTYWRKQAKQSEAQEWSKRWPAGPPHEFLWVSLLAIIKAKSLFGMVQAAIPIHEIVCKGGNCYTIMAILRGCWEEMLSNLNDAYTDGNSSEKYHWGGGGNLPLFVIPHQIIIFMALWNDIV